MASVTNRFRYDTFADHTNNRCINYVRHVVYSSSLSVFTSGCSTYWMAGLAHDAAHFFKFLFILVLYSMAMTLFVRLLLLLSYLSKSTLLEFPPGVSLPQRRCRHFAECTHSTLPTDLCGILCASRCYPTCITMAAMVRAAQVYIGGAHTLTEFSARAICNQQFLFKALSVNEVGSGLMIKDTLQGVPVAISASLIMEMVSVCLGLIARLIPICTAVRVRC